MPSSELRSTVLGRARSLVVKLGTQLLTRPDGACGDGSRRSRRASVKAARTADATGRGHRRTDAAHDVAEGWNPIDRELLRGIAGQIRRLRDRGIEVTMVSSGAIGSGCALLGMERERGDLAQQQALAAVGQPRLMGYMHETFGEQGLKVAQLLLTRGDFDDRTRFLNIRNCILKLHQLGCVPIANENDTVSIDELRFGDNDMLAALVTNLLRADALILLTVVDGILDREGNRLDLVRSADEALKFDRRETSLLGTGGIRSKIMAATLASNAGEVAVVANGREPDILTRLIEGESLGTIFVPSQRKLDSRRRWIGLTRRPTGRITVDQGAVAALVQRGKSLLASGIVKVEGNLLKGDVAAVLGPDGAEVARGLCNYSMEELALIAGKKSSQFEKLLGRPAYAEVIHRDNLVVSQAAGGGKPI